MNKIEIDLCKVLPEFRNPKTHNIGAIIVSIRRFGFCSPLIINRATGKLLAGHGRVNALRTMWNDDENPPTNISVTKGGGWMIPAVEVEIEGEGEALAYLIADNRLVELGAWDEPQLADVLKDLAAYDSGLFEITGFDEDDLGRILSNLEGVTQGQTWTNDSSWPRVCPRCGMELLC